MNPGIHPRPLGVVLTVAVLCGCSSGDGAEAPTEGEPAVQDTITSDSAQSIPVLRPEVLAEIPHDPSAYTQGLELHEGTLYEGTGLEGESELRVVDPATGDVRRAERSEEHTSELQSRQYLVCRLLLEKNSRQIGRAHV